VPAIQLPHLEAFYPAYAQGLVTPEEFEARTSECIAGFHDEHGAHDHHGPHQTL